MRRIIIFLLLFVRCSWAQTNVLLIVAPQVWQSSLTNYSAFKTRLGFDVTNVTTEEISGGGSLTYTNLHAYLYSFKTNATATNLFVWLIGDFSVIPSPQFKVVPSGREDPDTSPYYSDIYYQDLHTQFNRDGDTFFGEFDTTGFTQDFDNATFTPAFSAISNDVIVGRLPIPLSFTTNQLIQLLSNLETFERDTGSRKNNALMSAGRIIITNTIPADSWDYVMKGLVGEIVTNYPDKHLTTVVHIDTNYTDFTYIDHAVTGSNFSVDYQTGQNIIRNLINTNDDYSFLCNVSHGGSTYDFSLTRLSPGLPTNQNRIIALSMSCASYDVGKAALTSGVISAYLGSTAVVSPDYLTLFSFRDMSSAKVQRLAAEQILGQHLSLGQTYKQNIRYYIRDIQTNAAVTYAQYKPEILRNIVGFQIIGDPTLQLAHEDQDGDDLLDEEENYLGTSTTNADTDADGLPDGYEDAQPSLNPLISDGLDVDTDGVLNADEFIAGTDPLNSADFPIIGSLNSATNGLFVQWPSVTGRTYEIYATTNLISDTWTNVTDLFNGTGSNLTTVVTNLDGETLLFRLHITR